jgi:alkylated DNA repair dioxygenase AlkB
MTLFNDTELFTTGELRTEVFDIPDAELTLHEHFFEKRLADQYYSTLLADTPWKQELITIHGKTLLSPRLTAWYGKRRSNNPSTPLTPTLLAIQEKVEDASGITFTSVLLNYYRDGQDSVAWHRDHDKDFVVNPTVGSVSFGETRLFRMRHLSDKSIPTLSIPLHHGSFLLMGGAMQHAWEHQVPKTTKPIAPRINLTFRIVT